MKNLSGLSRRHFLNLAPMAAASALVPSLAVASGSVPSAKKANSSDAALQLGYLSLAMVDQEPAAPLYLLDPVAFDSGSVGLNGQVLRCRVHGLFAEDMSKIEGYQIDLTRRCSPSGCSPVSHQIWSFDSNQKEASSGAVFSFSPSAEEGLKLDIKAQKRLPSGDLFSRMVKGRLEEVEQQVAAINLTTGSVSGEAKLHEGIYVVSVPGLGSQRHFSGQACQVQTELSCDGTDHQVFTGIELPDMARGSAYLLFTISTAA